MLEILLAQALPALREPLKELKELKER